MIKIVDINSHIWTAYYVDGSYDVEGDIKFHEISFPLLDKFIIMPKLNSERQIAIQIDKHPDYCLVFRKQQHVRVFTGNHAGTDYYLGLTPDDGSAKVGLVEAGYEDPIAISKNPGGFRAWLLRDGNLKFSGILNKKEKILQNGIQLITLSVLE